MNKLYSVIFCCDGGYGRYLLVALEGLIKHSSPIKHYEIIIIDCGLDQETIQAIKARLSEFSNIVLKFQKFDELYQAQREVYYANPHISSAAYARFFLGGLTDNDLILYLDVDISIECDVAELIDSENPGDKLITAAPDIGMEICRRYEKGWIAYFKNVIQLDYGTDAHYFNSGVLVINRQQWVAQNIEEKLMAFLASDRKFQFFDQDVLNIICFGKVHYLNFRYNVMASDYKPHKIYHDTILDDMLTAYTHAANGDGRIIHYTTGDKPWSSPQTKLAASWWQNCRTTAVYEQCLGNLVKQGNVGRRKICFLGLALFKIKQDSHRYKFYFWKFHVFGWRKKANSKTYYCLGLPFLKITSLN
ncbi:glycosyltransferase family 8 protein [Bartonella sp. HY761]|uniref:glycosyltransferase family 8 protein n=1 Tax=Bartonella sp. HY761 TaxID=2979330 RepID=UPI0021E2B206|nr:glycosyltransferase family 8 protein [Bartonella sp. HY761]UXN08015.1 glycosyltransferase family 8 protein [Bartonella sp. HY761]